MPVIYLRYLTIGSSDFTNLSYHLNAILTCFLLSIDTMIPNNIVVTSQTRSYNTIDTYVYVYMQTQKKQPNRNRRGIYLEYGPQCEF